jgi:hypothetical protein
MRYKHSQFACDWLVIKDTLVDQQNMYSSVSLLQLEEIPCVITLCILRAWAVHKEILVAIDY